MEAFLANPNLISVFGFFLGAIVGSFINVCAYRIPQNKSVIFPCSFCPSCEEPIPWVRNIPLFSWLFQQGLAHCCSYKIPIRYFWVELFTAIGFAYLFYAGSSFSNLVFTLTGCAFVFLLISVIVIDMETMTIPDRFSIGGALLGLLLSFAFPSMHALDNLEFASHLISFFESLMGLLLGSSLLYWIGAIASRVFDREALGEGDVKLLGCIGAFCGWKGAVFTIFGGAMVGCIFMIPMLLLSWLNLRKEDLDKEDRKIEWGMEIPFGPFLAIAAILFWVGARFWVEEWFSEKLNPFLEFIGT